VTAEQVRQRYGGVSRMWIERRLKSDPRFPRPEKFGNSLLRMFDLDALESWERSSVAHPWPHKQPPAPKSKSRGRRSGAVTRDGTSDR
jgi:hypothetical protein